MDLHNGVDLQITSLNSFFFFFFFIVSLLTSPVSSLLSVLS